MDKQKRKHEHDIEVLWRGDCYIRVKCKDFDCDYEEEVCIDPNIMEESK